MCHSNLNLCSTEVFLLVAFSVPMPLKIKCRRCVIRKSQMDGYNTPWWTHRGGASMTCFHTKVLESGPSLLVPGLSQPGTYVPPGYFCVLFSYRTRGSGTVTLNRHGRCKSLHVISYETTSPPQIKGRDQSFC